MGGESSDIPLGPHRDRSTEPVRRMAPQGKHALFTTPPAAARDHLVPGNRREGREALFSSGPRQAGTVVIECSACGSRTRQSLVDLGVRLLSISVWLPVRRHSHWMRCPACHHHTWCAIDWNG